MAVVENMSLAVALWRATRASSTDWGRRSSAVGSHRRRL